jgi:hypothetical protein
MSYSQSEWLACRFAQPSLFVLMHFWQDTAVMKAVHQLVDARLATMTDQELDAEIAKACVEKKQQVSWSFEEWLDNARSEILS